VPPTRFTPQMGLLFIATFASEDLACISAGLLVAQGRLTFLEGFLGCSLGILVGDLGAFLLGRGSVRSKWICGRIASEKLRRAQCWIARRGAAAVFISRFTPGLRVATYFSAGLLKMSSWKFLLSLVPAITIWVPMIVWATMLFGRRLVERYLNSFGTTVAAIGVCFLLFFLLRYIRQSNRSRSEVQATGRSQSKMTGEGFGSRRSPLPSPRLILVGLRSDEQRE
jgi:membrane protein DedA with SNARE-associated domain